MQDTWTKIVKNLEKMLDPGIFRIWVEPLKAEIKGHSIVVSAPNAYMAEWVSRKLKPVILKAAAEVLAGGEISLEISAKPVERIATTAEILGKVPDRETQAVLPIKAPKSPESRWQFSFDDLVTGPSNHLAVAAAHDLCGMGQVRTLFVNSGPGLGKTHLAQACGKTMVGSGPLKVGYLTAEQFASRFVAAARARELEDLKQYLCSLDVFLLEDVHFLQRKKTMQEMILGVVKNLQAKGSRVIFTSSFAPRHLQDMDGQLVSLFQEGIIAVMERPDREMRKEILRRKAKVWQVSLPNEVCDVLSERLSTDVRQLESCLKNMIFKAKLLNAGLSVDLALETLSQYAEAELTLDLHTIIRLVCESLGLTEEQLRSKSRRQEFVHGRNTAYYLARKHTDLSLEEMGCIFNRRHSTVMRGITQVEQEMARESRQGRQFARAVAMIEKKCGITA